MRQKKEKSASETSKGTEQVPKGQLSQGQQHSNDYIEMGSGQPLLIFYALKMTLSKEGD